MKVRALLRYYARLKGHFDCDRDIETWLERLDATDWANKRVDALSKGMAQKIQFISAVVARPQLVILDEPFSGLDPVISKSCAMRFSSCEKLARRSFSLRMIWMSRRRCATPSS